MRSGKCAPASAPCLKWRGAIGARLSRLIWALRWARINAAGRLDDMSVGIACLLARDDSEAQELAARLNNLNIERREIEQSMLRDALNAFPETLPSGQTTLVAYRDDFHQGVVGIVASRLKDRFTVRPSCLRRRTTVKCAVRDAPFPICTCAMLWTWCPNAIPI